jgi:hypothetical protein
MTVGNPHNYKGKVTLARVYLNRDGYTSSGCYYGRGTPLFYFWCEDDPGFGFKRDDYFRASTREAAKAYVRALPLMCECRFYN